MGAGRSRCSARPTDPFYGGTYFRRCRDTAAVVPRRARLARPRLDDAAREVEASATQVIAQLTRRAAGVAAQPPGAHSLRDAATELLEGADRESGGFGGAPKFPTPTSLEALLAALDVLRRRPRRPPSSTWC